MLDKSMPAMNGTGEDGRVGERGGVGGVELKVKKRRRGREEVLRPRTDHE